MGFMSRVLVLENGAEVGRSVGVFATLAWVILLYLAIVPLTVGLIWRYKTDQYGWTSRLSNWNESAILCWFSSMFHFGTLFVGLGHVGGLLILKVMAEALGVSEEMYHMGTTVGGGTAGLVTIIDLLGLLYRCIFVRSMRLVTTWMDITTCVFLCPSIALGTIATVMHQVLPSFSGYGYDYRETISVWSRPILMMSPKPEYMLDVSPAFQMHIIVSMFLSCVWPFMRLVHVASAPLGYVTRSLVVYRSRDTKQPVGRKRGW